MNLRTRLSRLEQERQTSTAQTIPIRLEDLADMPTEDLGALYRDLCSDTPRFHIEDNREQYPTLDLTAEEIRSLPTDELIRGYEQLTDRAIGAIRFLKAMPNHE